MLPMLQSTSYFSLPAQAGRVVESSTESRKILYRYNPIQIHDYIQYINQCNYVSYIIYIYTYHTRSRQVSKCLEGPVSELVDLLASGFNMLSFANQYNTRVDKEKRGSE